MSQPGKQLTIVTINAVPYYVMHCEDTSWASLVGSYSGENVQAVIDRGMLAYAQSRGATVFATAGTADYP